MSKKHSMKAQLLGYLFLILFLCPFALGDTLNAAAPANWAIAEPGNVGFTFSTESKLTIKECKLFMNNNAVKTIAYNQVLENRVFTYSYTLDEGEHNWSITCTASDATTLFTPTRTLVVRSSGASEVTVTSRSTERMRGSQVHSFSIRNTAEQNPITIPKVLPGDYIGITLLISPSALYKELYYKQQTTKNGTRIITLQDFKSNMNYYLYQGQNTTINISASKIILEFISIDLNKATFIARPYVKTPTKEETIEEDVIETVNEKEITQEDETITESTEEQTSDEESEETINEITKNENSNKKTADDKPTPQKPPQQSLFTKFISWLVKLVGT